MSALRPCLVTTYEWSSKFGKNMQVDTKSALFHAWGLDCIESEEGNASYSVAIVEFDDGHIETHRPYAIRFTDRKGGTQ